MHRGPKEEQLGESGSNYPLSNAVPDGARAGADAQNAPCQAKNTTLEAAATPTVDGQTDTNTEAAPRDKGQTNAEGTDGPPAAKATQKAKGPLNVKTEATPEVKGQSDADGADATESGAAPCGGEKVKTTKKVRDKSETASSTNATPTANGRTDSTTNTNVDLESKYGTSANDPVDFETGAASKTAKAPAPKPCPKPCPRGASNGAEESKVMCPTSCGSKKCSDGPATNGGQKLVGGVCTARCSGETNGTRYCGEGKEYEGCDSVDCGSCVPGAVPTNKPTLKPSSGPTPGPTPSPTPSPSCVPSCAPTPDPTDVPTPPTPCPSCKPTPCPTHEPTAPPTSEPSGTNCPTPRPPCPTGAPTTAPTGRPTFYLPPAPASPPCKKPCGQPKQAYCPTACTAPTCAQGDAAKGGIKLMGPSSNVCIARCSRSDEAQSQRYCGIGPLFEGGDSMDCSGCHPGVVRARAEKFPPRGKCPSVCFAPNCKEGSADNGGATIISGVCTAHCSRSDIYGGLRYCGIGKPYESGDSADCTQCVPELDTTGFMQLSEFEAHQLN
jgi:hypothetical protein